MAPVRAFASRALTVLLAAVVCGVRGHARLVSPVAWNPNPSKTTPCGVGAGATALPAAANWVIGSTVTLEWQIVAGDGEGNVMLYMDPTGSVDPSSSASVLPAVQVNTQPIEALGFFSLTYTVPAVTCTGPSNTCTFALFSPTAWTACSTVTITAAASPVESSGSSCQTASGLPFCTTMNGASIHVATAGQTLAQLDAIAETTFYQNSANPGVFTSGFTANCNATYKELVCSNALPLCGTTSACQDTCDAAVSACVLTAAEAGLYNCGTYPSSSCTNYAAVASATAPGCCNAGQGFGIFLIVVIVAGLAAGAGYVLYAKYRKPETYNRIVTGVKEWKSKL